MFGTSKAHKQEEMGSLMRKKQLFRVQIRRQQKNKILNQLREAALIPQDIIQCANSLPAKIDQLIDHLVDSRNWSPVWNRTIADKLLTYLNAQLQNIDQQVICPKYLLYMFNYVMIYTEIEQPNFNALFKEYRQMGARWRVEQRYCLLKIIMKAITKYQNTNYLKMAKQVIPLQSMKLNMDSLKFYDFVIRNHPAEGFDLDILSENLFEKLIDSLGIVFYSVDQKIKMCQILIQVLYICPKQRVSQNWRLSDLFEALAFLIAYATDHKLLTERVLFLIFNVNIDAGSKIFLSHQCAEKLIEAMRDDDLPQKLRHIMAETYLSALCNLQSLYLPKYIKNHQTTFFSTVEYILQEFSEQKQLMSNAKQVLHMLLKLDQDNDAFKFKELLVHRQQIMVIIKNQDFGVQLVEGFQL